MGVRAVAMSPSSHPTNDTESVFVYVADTQAELLAATVPGHRPGDLGLALDRGTLYRWNGTSWAAGGAGASVVKVLTDNVATIIATVDCALNNTAYGGIIEYCVQCVSATNVVQNAVGAVPFQAVNEGGTVTGSIATTAGTDSIGIIDNAGGTYTVAWTVTVSGTLLQIRATVDTSLTPAPAGSFFITANVRVIAPQGAVVANG